MLILVTTGCGTAVRVTDASTGAPVPGAQWQCGAKVIATTGAAGTVRLDPQACPRWLVTAPGYEPAWLDEIAVAGERQAVLKPSWLSHFADGGSTAHPAKERLPPRAPCNCRTTR